MQVLDATASYEEAFRWAADVVWQLVQLEGEGAVLVRDALDSGLLQVRCWCAPRCWCGVRMHGRCSLPSRW